MEEQNKKPKAKNSKEYNLAYYHEVIKAKGPLLCTYCQNEYLCNSSLLRHQRRSSKCLAKQLQKQLDELKANIQN